MRTLFSTEGAPAEVSFRRWREVLHERFVPAEQTLLTDKPFTGVIEGAAIGGLSFSRVTLDGMRSEATASTIRRHRKHDSLAILVVLGGANRILREGPSSIQRVGDLAILDSIRPGSLVSADGTSKVLIEVPRRRFESALGPARVFSSITSPGALGSAALATTFLRELIRVHEGLDQITATRMTSIGLDLVIAAVAETLARDVPRQLQGDVAVQRAKLHIESNLADASLDPDRAAAAAGVSLRRLQELFRERGHCVAGWIWERRLQTASARLGDPARLHVPIGDVAHGCGFASQAHFSTRFKRRFGLTPRDFRVQAFERRAVAGAGAMADERPAWIARAP